MLEYFDPGIGVSVYLNGIYGKGVAGQVVVLAEKFASENGVFSGYAVPAVFTVDRAIADQPYVLKDEKGKEIVVPRDFGSYLYPIVQWFEWHRGERAVKDAASSKKIETLEGKVDLLKEILSPHLRVITEEEAEKLGIGRKP